MRGVKHQGLGEGRSTASALHPCPAVGGLGGGPPVPGVTSDTPRSFPKQPLPLRLAFLSHDATPPSLLSPPFKGPRQSGPFLRHWGASHGLLGPQLQPALHPKPKHSPRVPPPRSRGRPRHPDSAPGPRDGGNGVCIRPSPGPLSLTEDLLDQEEKACWEEWLTKVGGAGRPPGATGEGQQTGHQHGWHPLDHSRGLVPGGPGI